MFQVYKHSQPTAWVEIDLKALQHNFRAIRKLAFRQLEPKINRSLDMLSVVKADAYGHGMLPVAKAIAKEGGSFFAVSNLEEAVTLRKAGHQGRILLFEATLPELAKPLVKYDLTPCLCSWELAEAVNREARKMQKIFPVHVKIDTGMGRLGVWHKEAVDFVLELTYLTNLHVEGLLTHFPVADTDRLFTEEQITSFADVVAELIKERVPFKYLHAANSMGLGAYKNRFFNLVRPGVMLYGLYPDEALRSEIPLKPVMSVKARVLMLKNIEAGRGISYGHTFRASTDMKVAVVGIGYSDGFFRALSNRAQMLVNGKPSRVLGRVTMDQTIIDITRAGKVSVGDEVIVAGKQGKAEVTLDQIATWAGTINYEVACNLGNRLMRVYKNR